MSVFTSVPTFYVQPEYLLKAARRKYGRRIQMIGALESSIAEFWGNVEAKAPHLTLTIGLHLKAK